MRQNTPHPCSSSSSVRACATPAATASCSQSGTLRLGVRLATTATRRLARCVFLRCLPDPGSPAASSIAAPSRSRAPPRISMTRQGRSPPWSASRETAATSGTSSSCVGAPPPTDERDRRPRSASRTGPSFAGVPGPDGSGVPPARCRGTSITPRCGTTWRPSSCRTGRRWGSAARRRRRARGASRSGRRRPRRASCRGSCPCTA